MKLNWGLHLDWLDRPEVRAYVYSRCRGLSSQFQCIAETRASDQSSQSDVQWITDIPVDATCSERLSNKLGFVVRSPLLLVKIFWTAFFGVRR